MDAAGDQGTAVRRKNGGNRMKREIFIGSISLLAEIGSWTIVFLAGLMLTAVDFLVLLVVAGLISGLAALVVWSILDVNLPRRKKSPRDAARKAQNK